MGFDPKQQNWSDSENTSDMSELAGDTAGLPEAGLSILLIRGTAEICAGDGMLFQLSERYDVWIEVDESRYITGICEREKRRKAAFDSLTNLQRRIVDGLQSGRFKSSVLENIPLNDAERDSAEYRLLCELLSLNLEDGFLFSGDRFLTAFAKTPSTQITDLDAVLKWLQSDGILTVAKARKIRRSMRDTHVHFLPYRCQ